MKLRNILLILTLFLVLSSPLLAGSGASWLEIGPGGRAAALAEAVTASVEGPTATYWNPAAAGNYNAGFEVQYGDWIAGTATQYVSADFKLDQWGLGFSALHVSVDEMELRSSPSSKPQGTFDARDYGVGVTLSRELPLYGIRTGATVRYIRERIYFDDADGYSFDFGLLKQGLFNGKLDLAATARHIGKMEKLSNQRSTLPATYSFGTRFHFGKISIAEPAVMLDAVQVKDQDFSLRGAVEIKFAEYITLRGGYATGYDARGLSAGFGLNWQKYRFEYGYSPFDNDLGNAQRFSIGMFW